VLSALLWWLSAVEQAAIAVGVELRNQSNKQAIYAAPRLAVQHIPQSAVAVCVTHGVRSHISLLRCFGSFL
jgi:hypothetical protein